MGNILTDLSFDEWIRYVFDHPVTKPEWHWGEDRDAWGESVEPGLTVSYLTSMFEIPVATLADYSDAQINQGLWFLVSNNYSDHMFTLKDKRVPLSARVKGLRSMFRVFEELFLPRCSVNLNHLDETDKGTPNPLDSICYMWWDVLPIHGSTAGPDVKATADAILDVMTRSLALNSDACRESALHGLGHWHYYGPKRIERVVDKFLANHRSMRPELITFAQWARKGQVQ